jgi:hypothetical protein
MGAQQVISPQREEDTSLPEPKAKFPKNYSKDARWDLRAERPRSRALVSSPSFRDFALG